jgi:iron complex transport system substrate-binding protein
MNELRLISFLPAATEMAFALGLGDRLFGISHECDFPAAAKTKPVVVKAALPLETMSLREIDVTVAQRIGSGQSLYEVDEQLLTQLAPTHILTQELCYVCAPSGNEITRALATLPVKPEILWFTPHSIEEIFGNLRDLGAATGTTARAEEIIAAARARLQKIAALAEKAPRRPRVFCLEWIDPYYCCGHWVPEMVELAGGDDVLGRKGKDSVRIPWEKIAAWSPEVLIVSPCGFSTEKAIGQAEQLLQQPGWSDLPAVRNGRVFAVDANAYFARPGPRVVDGVELLAHAIHPEIFEWNGPPGAFQKITPPKKSRRLSAATRRGHAHAFTLVELLIVIAIIAILSAMLLPVLNKGKLSAQCGVCQGNLRELGLATQMYWNDNAGNSFAYTLGPTNNGVPYWFGWIANGTEGHRAFNLSLGALFPYMNGSDVRLCPSPVWNLPQFEPKGTNVIFSYGCNSFVFGGPRHSVLNAAKILHPADTIAFADAAEVNNFQAPASMVNPLFEEWYYVDLETNYGNPNNYPNTQFRHSQKANVTFADGHVDMERFVPGSIDPRLPSLLIGQLPPQLLTP